MVRKPKPIINNLREIREEEFEAALQSWRDGDPAALPTLVGVTYRDLRDIAGKLLRTERAGHTLQATGLVSELYLRLAKVRTAYFPNSQLFLSFAARAMRMILVDYARESRALKRPGPQARVPLHENIAWINAVGDDMLALEIALQELEALDARKARGIELRYFLGCGQDETAEALNISRMTLHRDLEFARSWLYRRLNPDGE